MNPGGCGIPTRTRGILAAWRPSGTSSDRGQGRMKIFFIFDEIGFFLNILFFIFIEIFYGFDVLIEHLNWKIWPISPQKIILDISDLKCHMG